MRRKELLPNKEKKLKAEENRIVAEKENQELTLIVYLRAINEILNNFNETLRTMKSNQRKLDCKNLEELELVISHFRDQSQKITEHLSEITDKK